MGNHTVNRVLVVDDHRIVRQVMSTILSGLGVKDIVTAKNGAEAVSVIQGSSPSFDLVFCDLNMPVEDGLVFLRRLSGISCDIAIVLMSGEDRVVLDSSEILGDRYGLRILGVSEKPLKADRIESFLTQAGAQPERRAPLKSHQLSPDDIDKALKEQLFRVYFQPQLSLQTRKVCGLEALVRLQHPELGILTPDCFIEVAEKSGQIHPLTDYVIEESLRWLKYWLNQGHELTVSINLSARTMDSVAFADRLMAFSRQYEVPPNAIVCELTETMLSGSATILLDVMARLRMMKFNLSIDDFGTGYASLEQLHALPFHELKIDRCFVQDFDRNEKSRSILINSLRLASDLKLTTVAEGVETESTLHALTELGCHIVQGYYISKPMPADAVSDALAKIKL